MHDDYAVLHTSTGSPTVPTPKSGTYQLRLWHARH